MARFSVGSSADIANPASINVTGDLTVFARVLGGNGGTWPSGVLIGSYLGGTPYTGWGLGFGIVGGNTLQFWNSSVPSWAPCGGTPPSISDGNWHDVSVHLRFVPAVTSYYINFMIDGIIYDGGFNQAPASYTGVKKLFNSTISNNFTGSAQDIAIWNCYVDFAAMATLSAGGCPGQLYNGNLVAYWPIDGVSDPELDWSGNSHHAVGWSGSVIQLNTGCPSPYPQDQLFKFLAAASGGGSTNVTLAGVAATGAVAAPSVQASSNLLLSVVSATGLVEPLSTGASVNQNLTSVSATGAVTALAILEQKTLSAASTTSVVANFVASELIALTPVAAVGAVASLAERIDILLGAVSASGAAANFTVQSGGNASVNLIGVAAVGTATALSANVSESLSLASVSGLGAVAGLTVSVSISDALAGVAATGLAQAFVVNVGNPTLVGVAANGTAAGLVASLSKGLTAVAASGLAVTFNEVVGAVMAAATANGLAEPFIIPVSPNLALGSVAGVGHAAPVTVLIIQISTKGKAIATVTLTASATGVVTLIGIAKGSDE